MAVGPQNLAQSGKVGPGIIKKGQDVVKIRLKVRSTQGVEDSCDEPRVD